MNLVIQLDYTAVLVNLLVMLALSKASIYAKLLSRAPGAPQSPEGSPWEMGLLARQPERACYQEHAVTTYATGAEQKQGPRRQG